MRNERVKTYLIHLLAVSAALMAGTALGKSMPQAGTGGAPTFSRDDARAIIAQSQKIVSPDGIQAMVKLHINGIDQWLSVRGQDRRNPILLVLHGGPGAPDMPLAYTFQTPWEDYFTVVQWDQRGAGKTYGANDPAMVAPTMNIPQMTKDAAAVVRYLRAKYHKRKIFLLGHSFGSVLGVRLAQRHPQWFYAYIGVGQIVNMRHSEAIGYAFALREARAHRNQEAVAELRSIAPYPGKALTVAKVGIERKWSDHYGGLAYGRTSFAYDSDAETISPAYSDADIHALDAGSLFSIRHLFGPLINVDFDRVTSFGCPIILFVGRHDYSVSHQLTAQWFRTIHAPYKKLVWFDRASHMIMQDEPGRFLMHLVNDARPFAARVGDVEPGEQVWTGNARAHTRSR